LQQGVATATVEILLLIFSWQLISRGTEIQCLVSHHKMQGHVKDSIIPDDGGSMYL
jgi:hypothetical protein